MKKLAALVAVLAGLSVQGQPLFYYGKDSVTTADFLRAYRKNHTGAHSEKALRNYLDLYIASRLKIAEARSRGYDTLPAFLADLESLRQQILPAYLNDREALDRLTEEAFQRSQKDLRLSHLFFAFQDGYDTVAAYRRATEALAALKKGQPFEVVAREYSEDPSARSNGGDMGYITVFTLPYELENLAYATPPGGLSPLYRSSAGYHLFRRTADRAPLGRLRAAQILLAFPPGATEESKKAQKRLADSLYRRLQQGDDFGQLAAQFSNDIISAASNGQLAEFGTGEYDPVFGSAAFGLTKDGQVGAPVETAHGYHIIKRLQRIPVATQRTAAVLSLLRSRVEGSDRMRRPRQELAARILRQGGFQRQLKEEGALWAYADSLLNRRIPARPTGLEGSSPLFRLGERQVTVGEFTSYAQSFRFNTAGKPKPFPVVMEEFLEATALDHYQNHLEKYNEGFRYQLEEFRDGNLFFEIMQREVWGRAQGDSAALARYYAANRGNYRWKESADAVIFYASDASSGRAFAAALRKSPSSWRSLVESMSEKIAADSGRFELEALPGKPAAIAAGALTSLQENKEDGTASLALVLKRYPAGGLRSFAEARGKVIADYQEVLEKEWLQALRKKYSVRVNEAQVRRLATLKK
jgi:peptidyl-prolyl cis-trans isomerase SurA